MSMNKPATIIRYSQSYPMDLKNMIPSGFNEPDNINEVPTDFNNPSIPPEDLGKTDLWQQYLRQLKDIPFSLWWQNAGKSLVVRRDGQPSPEGWIIELAYPQQLETAREFSISGDGTAPAVEFNGTAPVKLVLTDVAATSLKNPRDFSLEGAITSQVATFDATGNIVFNTSYNEIIPDANLPNWIEINFTDIFNQLSVGVARRTVVETTAAGITLTLDSKDKYIRLSSSGTVTVPAGIFEKDNIVYIRAAAGLVTITPGIGVTINPPYGQDLVLPGTGATVALICLTPTSFDLVGTTRYV